MTIQIDESLIQSKFLIHTALFFFVACGSDNSSVNQEVQSTPSLNEEVEYHFFDINRMGFNKVVCDPMGGEGNPSTEDGLIAELFYLDHRIHNHAGVQDFFDLGKKSTQKLFFTEIDVPTQVFKHGFT